MKITCVSDLHGSFPKTKGGDLLIVAGDCTSNDSDVAWQNFHSWISDQDYKRMIIVAGNHDGQLEEYSELLTSQLADPRINFLCDSGTEFMEHKIWGSPWTALFHGVNPNCKAFMIHPRKLYDKWFQIPTDTNILITHTPPYGILDLNYFNTRCGSMTLKAVVDEIKPKLHVFGHIHGDYGMKKIGSTLFVNAAHMNEDYDPVNQPIDIEI